MRQPLQRAVNFRRRHQLRFFHDAHWRNILAQGQSAPKQSLGRGQPGMVFHKVASLELEARARIPAMPVPRTADLSVQIGALRLSNPIIAASGTFGYGVEFAHLVDLNLLGGFVVQGLSLQPMEGAPAPRLCETPSGMLNAVGLQNMGVRSFGAGKLPAVPGCRAPVISEVFWVSR